MKIVVNRCYGSFGLSKKAYEALGIPWDGYGFKYSDDRTNPELVRVVETLGPEANGEFARLDVVDVPDDVEWTLEVYDGNEHIAEVHRTW